MRWLQLLAQCEFTIVPVKGKTNVVADALSRQPLDHPPTEESDQILLKEVLQKTKPHVLNSLQATNPDVNTLDTLEREYLADEDFQEPFPTPFDTLLTKT